MENLFEGILGMSYDAAIIVVVVVLTRAFLYKAPKYFCKILWGLVGLRFCIPFSVKSALSLMPEQAPEAVSRVATQVVAAPVEEGISFVDVLSVLWLGVGALILAYGFFSYFKLKLKILDSVLLKDNIYQSEKIESPFVCGFISPKIYLPYGLEKETMECVLQHEKTHIKNGDHILKCLGFVVLCIHWFNPLAWVSYFLLCKDIELSCDESVVKHYDADGCRNYAKALLDLGVNKVKLSACPVAFGEVSIKTRIKSVVKYKKASKILVVTSLFLCLGISLCFMTEPDVKAMGVEEKVEKVVSEQSTEPETEEAPGSSKETLTEPAIEPVTEPVTESFSQSSAAQGKPVVETTEEVFDDSMFENEVEGIVDDPINNINIMQPDLVDLPDSTSIYEGVTYNNYGTISSVIGTKPSQEMEIPTLFPIY